MFLVLRAFASGCTALTGVEAVSNGVPAFERAQEPQRGGDAAWSWALLATTMFAGITALALPRTCTWPRTPATLIGFPAACSSDRAQPDRRSRRSARPRRSTCCRRFTAAILVLAANTAFNGFPVLASLLGRDGYLPAPALPPRRPARVLQRDRRCSPRVASLLIVAFDAEVTRLIQLYILGVFLSFTLSQAGMVRHWARALAAARPRSGARCAASRRSTARARSSPGVGVRDRAGDEVRRRARGSSCSPRRCCSRR